MTVAVNSIASVLMYYFDVHLVSQQRVKKRYTRVQYTHGCNENLLKRMFVCSLAYAYKCDCAVTHESFDDDNDNGRRRVRLLLFLLQRIRTPKKENIFLHTHVRVYASDHHLCARCAHIPVLVLA